MTDKELMPNANAPPQPADYSPQAIQKNVRCKSLAHPLTLFPTAFGMGCAAFAAIANVPMFYLLALAGFVGPIWLVVQMCFRSDALGKRYLKALDERREWYKFWLMDQVKVGLGQQYATEIACEHAVQGCQQFDRTRVVREGIQELLAMKLNTSELTFHRFLAAAEQAYLSILDNLKDVVAALKSANSIAPDDLKRRIAKCVKTKQLSEADREEKETLEERLQLWNSQMQRVDSLLAKNERAITAMDNISSRISEWHTDQHFAASDVEFIITELHDLAQFAHQLNNHT